MDVLPSGQKMKPSLYHRSKAETASVVLYGGAVLHTKPERRHVHNRMQGEAAASGPHVQRDDLPERQYKTTGLA